MPGLQSCRSRRVSGCKPSMLNAACIISHFIPVSLPFSPAYTAVNKTYTAAQRQPGIIIYMIGIIAVCKTSCRSPVVTTRRFITVAENNIGHKLSAGSTFACNFARPLFSRSACRHLRRVSAMVLTCITVCPRRDTALRAWPGLCLPIHGPPWASSWTAFTATRR